MVLALMTSAWAKAGGGGKFVDAQKDLEEAHELRMALPKPC